MSKLNKMDKSNKLLAAAKRLEKAGKENSQAIARMQKATAWVANWIEDHVPAGLELPRGYRLRMVRSHLGWAKFLTLPFVMQTQSEPIDCEYWIDGVGGYLHGDVSCGIPGQTREGSLQFAKDIDEGLVEEISQFLEDRAKLSGQASAILEKSVKE
jgi:hypothetical protein